MSFFNSSGFMLQKMQEVNNALNNISIAIENSNNKLNQLDNFDYAMMTMGNYRIQNNEEKDTLDIEYLK